MNREREIERLKGETDWDFVIIGGGATGLGTAVDAALRGYRVALVEQHDFAKATSSRSTKLLHGGVRYLKQGNIGLVRDAMRERGLVCNNAPHLSGTLGFVIPAYKWHERYFYGAGLKLYDRLAGKLSLGRSRLLSREETCERLPTIDHRGLRGGVLYYDGQFDDSRMAVNLAQTAVEHGAVVVNYVRATSLIVEGKRVVGVALKDEETGADFEVRAKCVINAAGVFSDRIRKMETSDARPMLVASQGSHLILPREFLPGEDALMVPKTEDGRVIFALPWQGRTLLGTTDLAVDETSIEPRPLEEEIDYLLEYAGKYFKEAPDKSDVLSTFSGLRPLVSVGKGGSTAALSRDHTIHVSDGGLVTILGGKWTTYRQMASDVLDQAEKVAEVEPRVCKTHDLRLHGWTSSVEDGPFGLYGSDAGMLRKLKKESPELERRMHPKIELEAVQVVWAARFEMARTVEDVLSRRVRVLLHDARAAIEVAPAVAEILAKELGRDENWCRDQVDSFTKLARRYLVAPDSSAGADEEESASAEPRAARRHAS